jgi:hypothetical protein
MKYLNKLGSLFIAIVIVSLIPLAAFGQQERYELPVGNSVPKGPDNAPITIFEFLDFQ